MEEKLGKSEKSQEEWKKIYLQRFKDFHDNFSNEIPEEILHGPNPKSFNEENYKYKVRGNWLAAVRNNLSNCSHFKFFPEDFDAEWRLVFKGISDRHVVPDKEVRTTKDEIDKVDQLLRKAIRLLEN